MTLLNLTNAFQRQTRSCAFLHELFVATDWGERFAELIDEHVKSAQRGSCTLRGVGHRRPCNRACRNARGEKLRFLGVDESEESLELARVKAESTQ